MKPVKLFGTPKELGNQYYAIYKNLETKNYVMTISLPKSDRSLDQNAFYWKLLTEYAKWSDQNINELHNAMLSAYGVATGYYAIVPEGDNVEGLSDIHLKRTSKTTTGKDGKTYVYCQILKGSHELSKSEMSKLIEGLKNEIIGSEADNEINVEEY